MAAVKNPRRKRAQGPPQPKLDSDEFAKRFRESLEEFFSK